MVLLRSPRIRRATYGQTWFQALNADCFELEMNAFRKRFHWIPLSLRSGISQLTGMLVFG